MRDLQDSGKQCRTCLRGRGERKLLALTDTLANMINELTQLNVTTEDDFSQLVCSKCVKEVNRAVKFKNKCLDSAKFFTEVKLGQCLVDIKKEEPVEECKVTPDIKLEPFDSEEEAESPDENLADIQRENDEDDDDDEDWKLDIAAPCETDSYDPMEELTEYKDKNRKIIFRCNYCHGPFTGIKIFKKHLESTHPDKKDDIHVLIRSSPALGYICKGGSKKSEGVEYKCACGNFSAPRYATLLEHFKVHYGDKPIVCTSCEYRCANLHLLRNHMLTHSSDKPFTCSLCEYTCKNKAALRIHSAIHSSEKKYPCKLCSQSFKRASSLSLHKAREHDKKKNHACHLCEKRFLTPVYLRQHMTVHTGERPHICHLCGQGFSQLCNLKKHISVKHEGTELPRRYKCSHCDFTSKHASSFSRHMSQHTGIKDYKCDQCPYLTNNSYALKVHILRHTGETPYACDLCDYKCFERASLRAHHVIHTGEKKFLCTLCSYAGATRGALRRHKETHNTDLRYTCPNCPYKTNVRDAYTRHLRKKCQVKRRDSESDVKDILPSGFI